jgi:hypothetical protein
MVELHDGTVGCLAGHRSRLLRVMLTVRETVPQPDALVTPLGTLGDTGAVFPSPGLTLA